MAADTWLQIGTLATRLADADRQFTLRVEGLDIDSGAVLAVTGASGSGKTLFLELLSLLRAPEPGADYRFAGDGAGQDLAALWRSGPRGAALAHARGRLFGFVPQTGALVPYLSVERNVALTQAITGRPDPDRVARLLDRLGLAGVARLAPSALSIGQRQRAAIARALAHRPAFVIADEPTAALDPDAADAAMAMLLEVAAEEGSGVILSSHDLGRLGRLGLARLHFTARSLGPGQVETTAEVLEC
jgi:putative ABC transport system ATP-binding protein